MVSAQLVARVRANRKGGAQASPALPANSVPVSRRGDKVYATWVQGDRMYGRFFVYPWDNRGFRGNLAVKVISNQ